MRKKAKLSKTNSVKKSKNPSTIKKTAKKLKKSPAIVEYTTDGDDDFESDD
ncbi:MAG: hypothetical protein ABFS03_11215 [Chloroflexota bacterium]